MDKDNFFIHFNLIKGVKKSYINLHTHKVSSDVRSVLNYSIGIDAVPPTGAVFSAGLHPWSAESDDFEAAKTYLKEVSAVAIGEIGLDYARNIDRDRQIELFVAQLEIAQERNLPVIIHCVRAYGEVLRILRDYELKGVIFHGYTGSREQTLSIIDRGYYISLGKVSLQSNKTIESIRNTPLERLFLETDMNDIGIEEVYAGVAEILQISISQLVDSIADNYKKIFG